MQGTRVNEICQAQLFYATQPLEIRMFNDFIYQIIRYRNESVYRVVDDFVFI